MFFLLHCTRSGGALDYSAVFRHDSAELHDCQHAEQGSWDYYVDPWLFLFCRTRFSLRITDCCSSVPFAMRASSPNVIKIVVVLVGLDVPARKIASSSAPTRLDDFSGVPGLEG